MQQLPSFKVFKKYLYIFAGLVILGVLGFKVLTYKKPVTPKKTDPKTVVSASEQKVILNRDFEFKIPMINDQGQLLSKQGKVKFVLTDAELQNEIKLKGETKKTNNNQKYLLLRIELQNDTSDRLAIISNKYVRLIGNDGKKYSPDFHNAMVAVDPLSVRRDLVAYIVNNDAKNFTFQVGELDGQKQPIEIAF